MLNICTLMGRFTHSPELRTTKNGKNVMRFSLAVSRRRTNSEGQREVDFIDCIAWNTTAEFIAKYFKKGEPIIVLGSLETRQYEDRQGNKRKACEVIVREVNFCAFKKNDDTQNEAENAENGENEDFTDVLDDDLPF